VTDTELIDFFIKHEHKEALITGSRDVMFGGVYVGTVGPTRPALTREKLITAIQRYCADKALKRMTQ
jgi:hypothetical protein